MEPHESEVKALSELIQLHAVDEFWIHLAKADSADTISTLFINKGKKGSDKKVL